MIFTLRIDSYEELHNYCIYQIQKAKNSITLEDTLKHLDYTRIIYLGQGYVEVKIDLN